LQQVVKIKSEYGYFYTLIAKLAEVTLSAPITNAWPERGASEIKRIKTQLRNRPKNDMLNLLLHVSINGPAVSMPAAKEELQTTEASYFHQLRHHLST